MGFILERVGTKSWRHAQGGCSVQSSGACRYRSRQVGTYAGKRTIRAETRCGQEDCVPIGTSYQITFHTVYCRPCPGTLYHQLFHLFLGRHAPTLAPVHVGSIVLKIQYRLVVHSTIRTIVTVLCQRPIGTIAPLVGAPIIIILRLCLAPSEVVAILLGVIGTDVASCP